MFRAIIVGLLIGWEIWKEIDSFLDPNGEF